jgi:hypothetical protein
MPTPQPIATATPTPALATAPVTPVGASTVAAAPAPAVAGPNPAAQTFVDQMILNGVRLGKPADQRILVGVQSFALGDPVNRDLKLKLSAVQPHDIVFTDESGFQYHKRY